MLEWEPARWLFAAETECSAGWRLHYDCTILYFLCKCLSERFLFVSKAFVTVCVRARVRVGWKWQWHFIPVSARAPRAMKRNRCNDTVLPFVMVFVCLCVCVSVCLCTCACSPWCGSRCVDAELCWKRASPRRRASLSSPVPSTQTTPTPSPSSWSSRSEVCACLCVTVCVRARQMAT